jgi:predicted transcriptional regulator
MKSPCEVIVWDILPSIRAAIAEELVRRQISQKEVSKMLGITPPAVSQYVSKKRGYSIEFDDNVKSAISKLADDLTQRKVDNLVERICEICKMSRGDEASCGPSSCECD